MIDRLDTMLHLQQELQIKSMGGDPALLEGDERADFLRWNVVALTDELHEMLAETGWKPWATSRHLNYDEAMNEMVDAFHFFMNILLVIGGEAVRNEDTGLTLDQQHIPSMLAEILFQKYQAKREKNAQRQVDGYDGVSTKCPTCHRELSETPSFDHINHAGLEFCKGACALVYKESHADT